MNFLFVLSDSSVRIHIRRRHHQCKTPTAVLYITCSYACKMCKSNSLFTVFHEITDSASWGFQQSGDPASEAIYFTRLSRPYLACFRRNPNGFEFFILSQSLRLGPHQSLKLFKLPLASPLCGPTFFRASSTPTLIAVVKEQIFNSFAQRKRTALLVAASSSSYRFSYPYGRGKLAWPLLGCSREQPR